MSTNSTFALLVPNWFAVRTPIIRTVRMAPLCGAVGSMDNAIRGRPTSRSPFYGTHIISLSGFAA